MSTFPHIRPTALEKQPHQRKVRSSTTSSQHFSGFAQRKACIYCVGLRTASQQCTWTGGLGIWRFRRRRVICGAHSTGSAMSLIKGTQLRWNVEFTLLFSSKGLGNVVNKFIPPPYYNASASMWRRRGALPGRSLIEKIMQHRGIASELAEQS
jgi:hypothetical protein